MSLKIDSLMADAENLPLVPLAGATAYRNMMTELTRYVDESLTATDSINDLIGGNDPQLMYDNHRHHASFMLTVFSIGNYELLARTLPWVYRAYSSHNFSYDYFKLELQIWLSALRRYIDPALSPEILSIYNWMLDNHKRIVEISQDHNEPQFPVDLDWLNRKNDFLTALLEGQRHHCVAIAEQAVSSAEELQQFYLQVIQPAMYEIGMLWENGIISVAQEHLASAIVARVMASINSIDIQKKRSSGKAVIAAAPGEYHEIGAWMISDLLEHDGWQIRYLGANTPIADLLDLLRSFQPEILVLSVTMPFNILQAREIVATVRNDYNLGKVRIMVGGRIFNDIDGLWQSTGAHGFSANVQGAVKLARSWCGNA